MAGFVQAAVAMAADAPGRRRMGEAASVTAQALDWSSIVARFEGVLESVILRGEEPYRSPIVASRQRTV
jgi:hypothetical protein